MWSKPSVLIKLSVLLIPQFKAGTFSNHEHLLRLATITATHPFHNRCTALLQYFTVGTRQCQYLYICHLNRKELEKGLKQAGCLKDLKRQACLKDLRKCVLSPLTYFQFLQFLFSVAWINVVYILPLAKMHNTLRLKMTGTCGTMAISFLHFCSSR